MVEKYQFQIDDSMTLTPVWDLMLAQTPPSGHQELLGLSPQSVKITSVIYVTMKLLNQLDDNGPKT